MFSGPHGVGVPGQQYENHAAVGSECLGLAELGGVLVRRLDWTPLGLRIRVVRGRP